jgi:tetratricopeptide (TPR) repeat protein
MPGAVAERFDFFLSRRGSIAAVAQEVADVLTAADYKVFVQDYDIARGASFVEKMHEGVKNARDLVILFTADYLQSPYTRKEFTSFEAERLQDERDRHIVVLRCDDAPLRGLLADTVYQDLVGVAEPEERKRRILAAAERRSSTERPQRRRGRRFVGVPPYLPGFTGRTAELDRLDAILTQDRRVAVTRVGRAAVQGMGGVGKTTLAVEYANRFRNVYDGVWWCSSETRAGLLASLAALAKELEAASAEEADVEKAAHAALRALAEQGDVWLLVYDNATAPAEIKELLPAAGARVLITSRFPDWKNWADEVSLDVLPIAEAITFLENRAERKDEAGARTLGEALDRLPLALDHAATTCLWTQMSFAAYAAEASRLIESAPDDAPYPRSVSATFSLAIEDAAKQCPAAETLMAFLAYCAPERIPMSLVEGAIDDEIERAAALAALSKVSLVKRDPFEDGTPAVTVHRLVQAVARARSEAKGAARGALSRVIAWLARIYPNDGRSNSASWPQRAQLTPHLLASCEIKMADSPTNSTCAVLLARAGEYFLGRAAYDEARPLLERALSIAEKVRGPEHPETATRLTNLAILLQEKGDLAGARPLLERALAIREKVFGSEHPDTGLSLNDLGLLLQDQGDLARARSLLERALAISNRVLGPTHPETAVSLNNFAGLLYAQGNFAGARTLFERALAIREKELGPGHPDIAPNLNNLAGILEYQGELAGARTLFERALALSEKSLGPEHPVVARNLFNLARLLYAQGNFAGAQPLFERALAIFEKVLGPEHPDTAAVRKGLADLRGPGRFWYWLLDRFWSWLLIKLSRL